MSNISKKAEKLAVAVISVLFLGWVILQNHQQNKETEQRFIQVNAALDHLNTTLEHSNALQARQVSLSERSTGILIDTRNAVLEMGGKK
ncbi:hypothetical protein V5K00_RS21935 [Enterobacter asburiae]